MAAPAGAGHVGAAEPHELVAARGEERRAGRGRQLVRVGHAEHRPRLRRRERAQRDPVGQVRLQPAQPALVQPLRGQEQVQAERAAEAADRDHQVDQLRALGEQLGELVDHDDQRRERRQLGTGAARGGVIGDAHQVARRAQDLLAAHDLACQRVGHPVDQRELVGEVRDHGRDVRHAREAEERGAALEVDEHEVQRLGRMGGGQPEHEGAQELALAGPGGPDAEPVRPAAALGGLLQVQHDRGSALVDADRHPQPVGRGAPPPRAQRVDPRGPRPQPQAGPAARGRPARRPRRRPRAGSAPAVGPSPQPAAAPARRARRPPPVPRPCTTRSRPSAVDPQAHHRRRGPPPGRRPDPQHRDAGGTRPRPHRVGHPVHDDEQVRPRRGLGRPPAAQRVDLRREHPQRARAVAQPGMGVVRQPLGPLPGGQRRRARRPRRAARRPGCATARTARRPPGPARGRRRLRARARSWPSRAATARPADRAPRCAP